MSVRAIFADHHEIVTEKDVNVADKFGDFWDGKHIVIFRGFVQKIYQHSKPTLKFREHFVLWKLLFTSSGCKKSTCPHVLYKLVPLFTHPW